MNLRFNLIAVLILIASVFSVGAASAAQNNAALPKYVEAMMKSATNDLSSGSTVIRACLLDMDDLGSAITNATNATPIVITSTSHGHTTGDMVVITKVGGNAAAQGGFRVTGTDA